MLEKIGMYAKNPIFHGVVRQVRHDCRPQHHLATHGDLRGAVTKTARRR